MLPFQLARIVLNRQLFPGHLSILTKRGELNGRIKPANLGLAPFCSEEQNGLVKTSHTLIVVVGLVVIGAGCAMHVDQLAADPRTKYVVRFDAPTFLVSRSKFIEALGKASWRRDIVFTPKDQQHDPSSNDTASPISSSVVQTLQISQDLNVNPNSLQVTQRVGFNGGQERELAALLKQVKQ